MLVRHHECEMVPQDGMVVYQQCLITPSEVTFNISHRFQLYGESAALRLRLEL
jgi:hypothetical protein